MTTDGPVEFGDQRTTVVPVLKMRSRVLYVLAALGLLLAQPTAALADLDCSLPASQPTGFDACLDIAEAPLRAACNLVDPEFAMCTEDLTNLNPIPIVGAALIGILDGTGLIGSFSDPAGCNASLQTGLSGIIGKLLTDVVDAGGVAASMINLLPDPLGGPTGLIAQLKTDATGEIAGEIANALLSDTPFVSDIAKCGCALVGTAIEVVKEGEMVVHDVGQCGDAILNALGPVGAEIKAIGCSIGLGGCPPTDNQCTYGSPPGGYATLSCDPGSQCGDDASSGNLNSVCVSCLAIPGAVPVITSSYNAGQSGCGCSTGFDPVFDPQYLKLVACTCTGPHQQALVGLSPDGKSIATTCGCVGDGIYQFGDTCQTCIHGFTDAGHSSCTPCQANEQPSADGLTCEACPDGQLPAADGTCSDGGILGDAAKCGPGKHQATTTSSNHQFFNCHGTDGCVTIGGNDQWTSLAGVCECDAGLVPNDNGDCVTPAAIPNCPAGWAPVGAGTSYSVCGPLCVDDTGNFAQVSRHPGGALQCITCGANEIDFDNSCKTCVPGTTRQNITNNCRSICDAGSTYDDASGTCMSCDGGHIILGFQSPADGGAGYIETRICDCAQGDQQGPNGCYTPVPFKPGVPSNDNGKIVVLTPGASTILEKAGAAGVTAVQPDQVIVYTPGVLSNAGAGIVLRSKALAGGVIGAFPSHCPRGTILYDGICTICPPGTEPGQGNACLPILCEDGAFSPIYGGCLSSRGGQTVWTTAVARDGGSITTALTVCPSGQLPTEKGCLDSMLARPLLENSGSKALLAMVPRAGRSTPMFYSSCAPSGSNYIVDRARQDECRPCSSGSYPDALHGVCLSGETAKARFTREVEVYGPHDGAVKSLPVQSSASPRTVKAYQPNGDPGTVILKREGNPSTVILKPEGNPTTAILKPEGNPSTVIVKPKSDPTLVLVKPEGDPTAVILVPRKESIKTMAPRQDLTTPKYTTTTMVPRQDAPSKPTPTLAVPQKDLTPPKYTTTTMVPRQNAPTATVMVPRQPAPSPVITPTAPRIQMMPMPSPTAPRPKP